jgi:hypothetical protein
MTLREFLKVAAIQWLILLAGIAAIEGVLRLFLPLPPHGGEYVGADGKTVRIAHDADALRPQLDVRHVGPEFSVRVRTDQLGYRRMANGSTAPDFLFLGDSFTFGHGVADDEVFAAIFCGKRRATCLNLGRPGSNTFDEARLLRRGIETQQLRPRTVVVTVLAACWLGVAGNDLGDNLAAARRARRSSVGNQQPPVHADPAPWRSEAMRTLQAWVSGLEITKRVLIVTAGGLKRGTYACSDPSELEAATAATAAALRELAELALRHTFSLKVVVIHPLQDLAGGYLTSEAAVGRALPQGVGCIATGGRFRISHYYPYDGHFNPSGQAHLAALLDAAIDSAPGTCSSGA